MDAWSGALAWFPQASQATLQHGGAFPPRVGPQRRLGRYGWHAGAHQLLLLGARPLFALACRQAWAGSICLQAVAGPVTLRVNKTNLELFILHKKKKPFFFHVHMAKPVPGQGRCPVTPGLSAGVDIVHCNLIIPTPGLTSQQIQQDPGSRGWGLASIA